MRYLARKGLMWDTLGTWILVGIGLIVVIAVILVVLLKRSFSLADMIPFL